MIHSSLPRTAWTGALVVIASLCNAAAGRSPAIVPQAVELAVAEGEFRLTADTAVVAADEQALPEAEKLAEALAMPTGFRFKARHGEATAVHSEYGVGDFHRTFAVTEDINPDGITAELANGVLTLHLPKAEEVKPRRIKVQA